MTNDAGRIPPPTRLVIPDHPLHLCHSEPPPTPLSFRTALAVRNPLSSADAQTLHSHPPCVPEQPLPFRATLHTFVIPNRASGEESAVLGGRPDSSFPPALRDRTTLAIPSHPLHLCHSEPRQR